MSNRKNVESQVVASEVASEAPDNKTGTRSCAPRRIEPRVVRAVFWDFARLGHRLPAEPGIIVIERGW
jgi:hypothetical protein